MNTLIDTPVRASHENGIVTVVLSSGQKLQFPIKGNPRLEGASDVALSNIQLSPFGLHWPDIDEDLSIAGIRSGDYGQKS